MSNIRLFKIASNISINWQETKDSIFDLLTLWRVRIYLFVNIFLIGLLWAACYRINSGVSQDLIVLHYNVDYGINLVGSVKTIYFMPSASMFILLLNFLIAIILKKEGKLILNLLLPASILVNIFLLTAAGLIYLINFT